ncbi:MAG: hypothetical protein KJO22_06485, partial [Bacteroidia bacterium]|nr:hypothetical protein [Bacteroidia bacterium]
MKEFKENWEIQQNWQLLFPLFGLLGLGYTSYKICFNLLPDNRILQVLGAFLVFFVLLKLTLYIFKKLEDKWILTYRWEMIRVFIVFAVTGSSSLYV